MNLLAATLVYFGLLLCTLGFNERFDRIAVALEKQTAQCVPKGAKP